MVVEKVVRLAERMACELVDLLAVWMVDQTVFSKVS